MGSAIIKNADTTDCSLLLGSANTVLNGPFRLRSFGEYPSIYGPTFPTKGVVESDIGYTQWKK